MFLLVYNTLHLLLLLVSYMPFSILIFHFRTLSTIVVFVGTSPVYIYLCLDLRKAGPYSYYYYQNSGRFSRTLNKRNRKSNIDIFICECLSLTVGSIVVGIHIPG